MQRGTAPELEQAKVDKAATTWSRGGHAEGLSRQRMAQIGVNLKDHATDLGTEEWDAQDAVGTAQGWGTRRCFDGDGEALR